MEKELGPNDEGNNKANTDMDISSGNEESSNCRSKTDSNTDEEQGFHVPPLPDSSTEEIPEPQSSGDDMSDCPLDGRHKDTPDPNLGKKRDTHNSQSLMRSPGVSPAQKQMRLEGNTENPNSVKSSKQANVLHSLEKSGPLEIIENTY